MRLRLALVLAVLAVAVLAGMGLGLDRLAGRWILTLQGEYQNALGGALRALRAGEAGAVSAFLGVCLLYGLLHAAGPGHGKALLGAYAATRSAPPGRLVLLAGITAMAQAAVAVILVHGAVRLMRVSREEVDSIVGLLEPVSLAALALLGGVILWRGARGLLPDPPEVPGHAHGPDCGCSHLPDPAALAAADRREAALLVASVALRPCTGAVVMLALTWRLGLDALGVLGAFVMGAGTLAITLAAVLMGAGARAALLRVLPGDNRVVPVLNVAVGGALAALAGMTAVRLL